MQDTATYKAIATALMKHAKGLRAEALVAHLIGSGVAKEELLVGNQVFFQREYVNDISNAEVFNDEWVRTMIQVTLSRPGFYDMLPEGLFFQPGGTEYSNMGVAEMAALYRENKKKEQGVRNFFLPFEQAGFFQQLQVEEEEKRLLGGLQEGMLHQYFRQFWDLPAMDPRVTSLFILLVPFVHRICGNTQLMRQCLEMLLQEEVKITQRPPEPTAVPASMNKGLGEQALGDDMVCGNAFMEDYPSFRYSIGPLRNAGVTSYLDGGAHATILETFNRFFLPVEAAAELQIDIKTDKGGMVLSEESAPVLGYSSMLIND